MPFGDAPRDAVVERAEVGLHRRGLEGDAERLAMQAMLVEVHQHQPAREDLVENHAPAAGGGEILLPVEQNQLVGLGPEQGDAAKAEHAAAEHRAVLGVHGFDGADGIPQHGQRVADDRPAVLAWDVLERVLRAEQLRSSTASDRLQAWSWSAPLAQSLPPQRIPHVRRTRGQNSSTSDDIVVILAAQGHKRTSTAYSGSVCFALKSGLS